MPYLRLVRSGDQLEAYEYEKIPVSGFGGSGIQNRKKRVCRTDSENFTRRIDNLRRLRRDFQRLVRVNLTGGDPPLLITLTMYQIVGVSRSYEFFRVFIERLRKSTKTNFRYISVVEFQKRGAVHFHLLVWGVAKSILSDERNSRRIQHLWQRGFVDCIVTDGSERLAGYLAKYLSKAMSDRRLVGERAYSASRNVLRPLLYKFTEEFDDVADYFLGAVDNSPLLDRQYDSQWLGKGRYRLYKINQKYEGTKSKNVASEG